MRLGFLTACMPERSLEEIAAWAGGHGYEALELAAWPRIGDRPFTASHIGADGFDEREADRVRKALDANGLELSALAYYDNNLEPDPDQRAAILDHLRACIDDAAALGCPPVGTFIGRDAARSVADNLREAEQVFPPLVDYAGERGVKLMIENCVMEGWHPDGYPGNLAYSPELWEWMFELGLYLNFDPSHLLWLGAAGRIAHVHACGTDRGSPGADSFGWPEFLEALREGGYEGPLCIESFTAANEVIATAASIWRPLASSPDALARDGLRFLREAL